MASTETKILDNYITSRRALLAGGGAALAALAMPGSANAALPVTAANLSDAAILNFALNLEYLEANFYYLAAFGTTIDVPNLASMTAGAPGSTGTAPTGIPLNGLAYQGTPSSAVVAGVKPTIGTAAQVPFTNAAIKSYAIETAIEEGKHVAFLRSALTSANAIAQPMIDLSPAGAWTTLATAALGAGSPFVPFNPYANDAYFLIGAYVFEDVGVSAYHGAAPLISQTAGGKSNLLAAGGILAVEAYHAGIIRTTLNAVDAAGTFAPAGTLVGLTQQISKLRATLAFNTAASPNANAPYDPNPDDYGLSGGTTAYNLAGTSVMGTQIVDADPTNVIAFARTTTQVLNIVVGGASNAAGSVAKGVFFPQGLNGVIV